MKKLPLKKTIAILAVSAVSLPLYGFTGSSSSVGSSDIDFGNLFGSLNGSSSSAPVTTDDAHREGWKLQHQETFDTAPNLDAVPWVEDTYGDDSPWHVDEFDDDGIYFKNIGGPWFDRALDSFKLLRKRAEIGEEGWLTVEIGTRDINPDGTKATPPTLDVENGAAKINVPWDGGLIFTATDPLPSQYRVEYELKTLDFGGKRPGGENDGWDYDGKTNGYTPGDCKTNFPWARKGDYSQEGADKVDGCAKPWGNVTAENGYYLLSIMDYAKPAPHNNIFIHSHRKVGMDIYSVNGGWARVYKACNPATKEIFPYTESNGNGVNEIFFDGSAWRDKAFAYNQFIMPTECGVRDGADKDATIVSAVELQPELMPEETYTFAIERTATGYVQEMSGNFKNVGHQTYRYERPFISEDGHAIWHYNQTPDEYDGRFNDTLTFEGEHGSFSKEMWPSDSAYPDNFVIGIPHLNYYEGSATVDNIRLYTPE
ncbi:hypothetical protein [Corynebacterium pygosceleis]|uniref:hypothetical protein n=1 Tax=Corynebacterium pygosceleis TaxID=2800406 RepID=UPI0020046D6B|nr:hypothetical protein [Corynebacterium pygosceleis]MCK7675252.1 hypothetical protein [Corynebacterium pygosceleis]